MRALREAGAVILGKTTTTEFASFHAFHETRNPHDLERTPGGSSSGSAAAVAAGMVPVALGTQVVGSILRPSSYCGVVGFKPTFGAINRGGVHDHFSQGCQGAIGATLADTWLTLSSIAARAGGDPGYAGLTGHPNLSDGAAPKRLAILETGGWSAATEGARSAFSKARRKISDAGIEVRSRIDDPGIEALEQAIANSLPLTLAINTWEGRWPRNTYTDRDASKLSASAIERIRAAEAMTQEDIGNCLRAAPQCEAGTPKWRTVTISSRPRGIRRGTDWSWVDRQCRHEHRRFVARSARSHRAGIAGREPSAWIAASRRRGTRCRLVQRSGLASSVGV